MSPGGKYVLYFDETQRALVHLPRRRRRAREPHREDRRRSSSRRTTRRICPGAYGVGGWTADDKSVLLYDKFDIWEVKPDGTQRRAT